MRGTFSAIGCGLTLDFARDRSCKKEIIDHVIVFNEDHLRRLLCGYVSYYNSERVHTIIRDAPEGRAIEARPSPDAKVVGLPRVGGLHHRYVWQEAA